MDLKNFETLRTDSSGVTESIIGRCVDAEKRHFVQKLTRDSTNREPCIPSGFSNKLQLKILSITYIPNNLV